MICTAHQFCSGDENENNEVGGACSAKGGDERRIQDFVWGILKVRVHLEDPCEERSIILRLIFRK
jgi:hypothetical protein